MRHFCAFAALFAAASIYAGPRDVRVTFELLKSGPGLSSEDAGKLEAKLQKKPGDENARVQLLAYYAARPAGMELAAIRAARARHIFWVIEHDPKDGLGLFQVATGVYRLHCAGDDLADPAAAHQAGELWLQQLRKNPEDASIRGHAVDAFQYCQPEEAEKILIEAQDNRGLGRLYADAVLGVIGEPYLGNDEMGTDPALRETAFAGKARRELEESTDKEMLVGATVVLLHQGGVLWADGKLDWDYSKFGQSLLARALDKAPNDLSLLPLSPSLPRRGERPPMTIRVGGNVQAANLIRKVTPPYPPTARDAGVSGTVRMTALINLDGTILGLNPTQGPTELIQPSIDAVRQWTYKPTTLNGKPCYVLTVIDVNYTLSPR